MGMKKLSFSTEVCEFVGTKFANVRTIIKPPKALGVLSLSSLDTFPLNPSVAIMSTKVVSLDELRQHTTKENIWVLLNGKGLSHRYLPLTLKASDYLTVYDVSKFIEEVYHLLAFLSSATMRLTQFVAPWGR